MGGRRKLVADMTAEELKVAREKNRILARKSRVRHRQQRLAMLEHIETLGKTNETLRQEVGSLRATMLRLRLAVIEELRRGWRPALNRVFRGCNV